jgi:hypothetical protein
MGEAQFLNAKVGVAYCEHCNSDGRHPVDVSELNNMQKKNPRN